MRLTAIAMGIVLVCGQACFGDWLLEWGGTVTEIKDGADADVSWGPVTVGDTVSASLRYDPATFEPASTSQATVWTREAARQGS